jgi:hypothetical protein
MTKLEGCRVEIGQQPRKEKVSPAFDLVIRRPIAAPGARNRLYNVATGQDPERSGPLLFPLSARLIRFQIDSILPLCVSSG